MSFIYFWEIVHEGYITNDHRFIYNKINNERWIERNDTKKEKYPLLINFFKIIYEL